MLFKLISKLPLTLLYPLSWPIYWVIYYVLRYRRRIVREHLCSVFPDHSEKEIRQLEKRYYKNLADVTVEIVKAMGISKEELENRVAHKNFEIVNSFITQGKSFILLSAHSCNWEWSLLAVGLKLPILLECVYKPLHSKYMDRIFYAMRTRFGAKLVDTNDLMAEVIKNRKNQRAYVMLADQKPRGTGRCHNTRFLNRETLFFIGPEKIAQFAKLPIIFVSMKRIRRGYYELDYQLLAEPPYKKVKDDYPITEKYARAVETHIFENPDSWLWSNRRWRVRNPENLSRD